MKTVVTKLEVQSQNKDRVNVYTNEQFAFSCSAELVYRYKLSKGKEIDVSEFTQISEEDNFLKCKNDAIKLLEKRYKTEKQIKEKLFQKGYEIKAVDRAICFLKEYRLLDDEKYAEQYIQNKVKSDGKLKIKNDMLKRGFSLDTIKEHIGQIDEEVQREGALSLGEKKYESLIKTEKDFKKIYKKLGDYLLRKGYEFDEVRYVLNTLLKKAIDE